MAQPNPGLMISVVWVIRDHSTEQTSVVDPTSTLSTIAKDNVSISNSLHNNEASLITSYIGVVVSSRATMPQ